MLAEYDENGSLTTLYTRGSELISQERNGEKSYYLYDGFDSVRMLADNEGVITDTYNYDAFGNLTESTGETENSFLYRGERFDSFTGLYYLRARYMNPSTGTFIAMDEYAGSIFEPVSLHKYLYANANPVTYSDPTGYFSFKEATVSIAMHTILGAAIGACYGGVLNVILTTIQGGTLEDVGDAFYEGAIEGLKSGALFGFLGGIATYFYPMYFLISAMQFTGGYYAFQDAIYAASEGDWGEAGFYATVGFVSAFSSASNFKLGITGYKYSLILPDGYVTVTRWGRAGLESNDWVMKGNNTLYNYIFSGKWQPGSNNSYALKSSGETFIVPENSLKTPSGQSVFDTGIFAVIKWLLGQNQYQP